MWTETHALRYAAVMCRVRSWTCTTPRPHSTWVCASLQLMVARLAALEADNYVERNDDEADSDEWVSDSVSLSNRCPRCTACSHTAGWFQESKAPGRGKKGRGKPTAKGRKGRAGAKGGAR